MTAITSTDFHFSGQTGLYKGKVRDVYYIGTDLLVVVATDRISAFDVVLPKGIPYKGQVLNQLANHFLDATAALVPNWKLDSPHPNVTIGKRCRPFAVEMVVRAYLSGSAWRAYRQGQRQLCGNKLPDGLREHQQLPHPIITPTTKATEGHDTDIEPSEIIRQRLMSKNEYEQAASYALKLFEAGTRMAAARGLILVDTKYEFGKDQHNNILLIDEVHTPDSSRFFYAGHYEENLRLGRAQHQLSKEFVREWLMQNGFMGLTGQPIPEMTDAFVNSVTNRYVELYEQLTGLPFLKGPYENISEKINQATSAALRALIKR